MRIQYFGQTPGRRRADRCAQFSWRDNEERFALDVIETLKAWGWPIEGASVGDDNWTAIYCPVWDKEEYETLKFEYKCAQGAVKKGKMHN